MTLKFSSGTGEEESFFYAVCYAVQFKRSQKEYKPENYEELKKDLADDIFSQLI